MSQVKALQPRVVHSGEVYESWEEVVAADADLGGQGFTYFHEALQHAVLARDLSAVEDVAQSSGADGASVVCYLHSAYDGRQPGRCPSLYFRDTTATMRDVRKHTMWVALEAASGIVPQHDFDPDSTWHGAPGGAWWNVTADPFSDADSPLLAFEKHRALNRLALRTKLTIFANTTSATEPSAAATAPPHNNSDYQEFDRTSCTSGGGMCTPLGGVHYGRTGPPFTNECAMRCRHDDKCACFEMVSSSFYCQLFEQCAPSALHPNANTTTYVRRGGPAPLPTTANGALAYLKHDSLGPDGDAAVIVFNPAGAQSLVIDLSALPPSVMGVAPAELLPPVGASPPPPPAPPLAKAWRVHMGAGEVRAFGGFGLGVFAPRAGKRAGCVADDGYRRAAAGDTLQKCFLECRNDAKCANVFVDYTEVPWFLPAPPLNCTLLGAIADPAVACQVGNGTLVTALPKGRPREVDEGN